MGTEHESSRSKSAGTYCAQPPDLRPVPGAPCQLSGGVHVTPLSHPLQPQPWSWDSTCAEARDPEMQTPKPTRSTRAPLAGISSPLLALGCNKCEGLPSPAPSREAGRCRAAGTHTEPNTCVPDITAACVKRDLATVPVTCHIQLLYWGRLEGDPLMRPFRGRISKHGHPPFPFSHPQYFLAPHPHTWHFRLGLPFTSWSRAVMQARSRGALGSNKGAPLLPGLFIFKAVVHVLVPRAAHLAETFVDARPMGLPSKPGRPQRRR